MVNHSKYILCIIGLMLSLNASAQLKQQGLNPVERDMEITRVTLENFLKRYEGAMLLNRIKGSKASYSDGKGVEILLEAPNASVIMNTQSGRFSSGDDEVLDTFYSR